MAIAPLQWALYEQTRFACEKTLLNRAKRYLGSTGTNFEVGAGRPFPSCPAQYDLWGLARLTLQIGTPRCYLDHPYLKRTDAHMASRDVHSRVTRLQPSEQDEGSPSLDEASMISRLQWALDL